MKPILFIAVLITLSFHVLSQEIRWEGLAVDFSHGKLVVAKNNRLLFFSVGWCLITIANQQSRF